MAAMKTEDIANTNVFVARQPIFISDVSLAGYELLFRSSATNAYSGEDGDLSTMEILSDCLIDFGLDELAGKKKAFINFTASLLRNDAASMLPPERVVIEILEDVPPERDIVDACIRLKSIGYTIALDDFADTVDYKPLTDLADIIKVDFRLSNAEERSRIARRPWAPHVRLLAEKVETVGEFESAKELGYSLFQGYFFSRPHVLSGRVVSPSEFSCLEAFLEIQKPEMDYDVVADIIKRDVSFAYTLLRFINSAAVGLRTHVQSIRQALLLLGQKETARWLSLVALRQMGRGKPGEVLVTCIVRGRMGEMLAGLVGLEARSTDMFMLGVFSAIDALLGRPVEEVVMELPLAPDVQAALLGETNSLAQLFRLVLAYEHGEWSEVTDFARRYGVDESAIADTYRQAVAWANAFAPSTEASRENASGRIRGESAARVPGSSPRAPIRA